MNNEPTQDLTDSEILRLLLADMRDVKARLSAMEDERARDNKPLLGEIRKEIAEARLEIAEVKEGQGRIEARMKHLEEKFEVFTLDIMDVRTAQRALNSRMTELERRPS
jgi:chromosome segregation ATPase